MSNFLVVMKYVAVILVLALLTILFILLSRRNSKISSLELAVRELKAKLELEKLTSEYNSSLKDLVALREKDKEIDQKLGEIEISFEAPLSGVVSADEIAETLKRLGL